MNDHIGLNSATQSASSKLSQTQNANDEDYIADLLNRQDSVLERLDELNLRIENAILEIGKARQELKDFSPEAPTANSHQVNGQISKAA